MSKPMSEQMQQVAARYEKATGKKFDQMTNADHIRYMTDEELAEFLLNGNVSDVCPNGCDTCDGDCDKRMLDWLKQPCGGDT